MRTRITAVLRFILVAAATVAVTPLVAPPNAAFAAGCTNPAWDPWYYEADTAYTHGNGIGFNFHRKPSGPGAGQLEYRWQDGTNSDPDDWSEWILIGEGRAMRGSPSATTNRDGRVVVFVVADDTGEILYKFQPQRSINHFTNWHGLGGVGASNPEVAQNADGRIEVFVRGTTNQVYHRWQDLSYIWNSDWASLGGDVDSRVKSSLSSDGKIVVEARGRGDCFSYSKWQYWPGGDWYPSTWWYQGGYLG